MHMRLSYVTPTDKILFKFPTPTKGMKRKPPHKHQRPPRFIYPISILTTPNMAEIGSEASLAISSSAPNWWDFQANTRSSLISMNPWHPQNSTSNSTCEDMSISNSFTNASNHSCLSVDNVHRELVDSTSSVTELSGESASENHLWSQILL